MKFGRDKILLTDSDIHVLHKLKHVLTDNGYEVFRASTPEKIDLLLKFYNFDLILFDTTILNLNIINFVKRVLSANSHTAVIISNDAKNYDLAFEAVKSGAYDLLMKPYDTSSLLSLIQDALINASQILQDKSFSNQLEPADNVYQLMIESSQDVQYILDDNMKFTFINKRIETLLGYNRSELIGKHYSEIVYYDDIDKAAAVLHIQDCINSLSQNIELRLKYNKNNDDFRYFDITSIPIPQKTYRKSIEMDANNNETLNHAATFAIAHDVTYRKRVEKIAHQKASYDHLTSLPNNILFYDRVDLAIEKAKRDNTIFAVMYIDLDKFKVINDTYGHHIGDKVLHEMSVRMRNCLRSSDTLARVGGDEFTLLLPEVKDMNEAHIIANKLFKNIITPFYINKNKHDLTASIGISFYPHDGITRELLILAADKAMYQVKHGHENNHLKNVVQIPSTHKKL